MKICDLCKKVTPRLNEAPGHLKPIEVCDDCQRDLLERLKKLEERMAESRGKGRAEVFAEWMRDRSPKESAK
jgi:hypothetical protein